VAFLFYLEPSFKAIGMVLVGMKNEKFETFAFD
jgi:hypothetical protein